MTAVTLVRRIRAGPEIVFDAFSTPAGLTSWWGPEDLPVIEAEVDLRIGGNFRVQFPSSDGRVHECAGQFLEIRKPELIVMSWRWTRGGDPDEEGRTSRLEFRLRPIDEGTELTLLHAELSTDAAAQSHRWGWNGALDKLVRTYTA